MPDIDALLSDRLQPFADDATGPGAVPDDDLLGAAEPDPFGEPKTGAGAPPALPEPETAADASELPDLPPDLGVLPDDEEPAIVMDDGFDAPSAEVAAAPPPLPEPEMEVPPPPPPDPELPMAFGDEHPTAPSRSVKGKRPARPRAPEPVAAAPEPAAVPAPPPAPSGDATFLDDQQVYRSEAAALLRARDWSRLAGVTSAALDGASWARLPETRAALLSDLARIYRDRLQDAPSAEDTFRRLLEVAPADGEAMSFVAQRLRERSDWRALYDLYAHAVEATWDPNQRLEWTRECVTLGDLLGAPDLAVDAWERLWKLGDAVDESVRALSDAYRRAGKWDRLAEFLARRAEQEEGAKRRVILREVVEACLSGLRDADRAQRVLDLLVEEQPDDPVALLALARVYARRRATAELAELGGRRLRGAPDAAVLDLRRMVADALWSAGDRDKAVTVYDLVLELDGKDGEALAHKREHLHESGRLADLVELLAQQAERAADDAERARLLEEAAELAERELNDLDRAVALLERRAALPVERARALEALAALYETRGDLPGLRRALEEQLALTKQPQARIDLLRRLGVECASRLGDDARAEACWREVLRSVPDDREVRERLIELYRRRGDFEAVDRALTEHAWRPSDDATLLELWQKSARNLEENGAEHGRAVRAWLRVLDFAPDDAEALFSLVAHCRSLGDDGELAAALEEALNAARSEGERSELAIEIAALRERAGDRLGALAVYERLLGWSPGDGAALAALARLRAEKERGLALGALDVAVAALEPGRLAERAALLEQRLELIDPADAAGRFWAERRLLVLAGADEARVRRLRESAQAANLWEEMAPILAHLAASAADEAARQARTGELARLYEEQLKSPERAFVTLQAGRQRAVDDLGELAPLFRLAESTNRWEDYLALLDAATRAEVPLSVRRTALRERARICEDKLKDARRAFHEHVRRLWLDPEDHEALEGAKRLAEQAGLWRQLDALYAELWDRADAPRRQGLLALRHALWAGPLNDPRAALEQLVVLYRIQPEAEGLEARLIAAAEALDAWDAVLPLLEARVFAGAQPDPDALARVARLCEEKRGDAAHAFDLYAAAFQRRAGDAGLEAKLNELQGRAKKEARLASTLRRAAARSGDPMRMLALYERTTELWERLGRTELALDLHQRILQLRQASPRSLDIVIAHQRKEGLWRELRDNLSRRLELGGEPAEASAWALEVAKLSRDQLSDPETAMVTYAQILEREPGNAEAIAGISSITSGAVEPRLERRRLRIELERASGQKRRELLLECARLEEEELGEPDAAAATLRTLLDEAGADGPGFAPLAALYQRHGRWGDLIDLLEQRAAAASDVEGRVARLREAERLVDEHAGQLAPDRAERLCRAILAVKPGDPAATRRLLQACRSGGRTVELVEWIGRILAAAPADADGRRELEDEEVRLLIALDRLDEADARLAARIEAQPEDVELLAARASLAFRRGDVTAYVRLRERQARLSDGPMGALILCHLAEVADEAGWDAARPVAYYREARSLDGNCAPAMEALKAIGRRTKAWRRAAALLPDADERELDRRERTRRLRERAETLVGKDAEAALEMYRRAVAVDVDDHAAWEGIAALAVMAGDEAGRYKSLRAALQAWERTTPPLPETMAEHARRVQALAQALAEGGAADEAARLSVRAHELDPRLPAAALAVADRLVEEGRANDAYVVFDRLLADRGALEEPARLRAFYRRGTLAAKLGRLDQAIADLRDGLRIDELHPGLLEALADVLTQRGRIAAAVQHYLQALLFAGEGRGRGELYARLGLLFEGALARADEAGVCFDLAVEAGFEQPQILRRALTHYRRSGAHARALEVIERLLPATEDPATLAQLWVQKGHILGEMDDPKATEAYDLALSYDPGCDEAVEGLAFELERRGDWKQLVEMLEVRVESGAPSERAQALRKLARISREHLADGERFERLLGQALALDPRAEDYEQLLAYYGDDPAHQRGRQDALAGLLGLGGPFVPRMLDLGRGLADEGKRRWAWGLLSPLLGVPLGDAGAKSLLSELRREFERSDNVEGLTPAIHRRVRPAELSDALWEALVALDGLPLGPSSAEDLGAQGVARIDPRTANGKAFAGLGERLGIEEPHLHRAQTLPRAFEILDGDTPQVVVRAELFQSLAPGEITFLFTAALELTRPGARLLASLSSAEAAEVVGALLAVLGIRPSANASLETRIRDGLGGDTVERLGAALDEAQREALAVEDAPARIVRAVFDTAWRVGLVACADLRFAVRFLTRVDEALPKLSSSPRAEDLESLFGEGPQLRALLGFAASSRFGEIVS